MFGEGAKEIKSLDELSQEDLRIFSIYSVALYKGAPHEKKMNGVFQQKNKLMKISNLLQVLKKPTPKG